MKQQGRNWFGNWKEKKCEGKQKVHSSSWFTWLSTPEAKEEEKEEKEKKEEKEGEKCKFACYNCITYYHYH